MKIKYEFADGTVEEVEVDDKIGDVIVESRRQEENLERKERYHCRVSFDSLPFDEKLFEDNSCIPESYAVEKEEQDWIKRFLAELTEVQRSRVERLMDGLSIAEIAKEEGVSFNTVKDSIRGVQKKLRNF